MSNEKKITRRTNNVLSWVEFWNNKIDSIEVKNEETIDKKKVINEKNNPILDSKIEKKLHTLKSNNLEKEYKKATLVSPNSVRMINSNILISKGQEAKITTKFTTNFQFFEIINTTEQIMNETEQILNLMIVIINSENITKIADVAIKVVTLVNEIYKVMMNIKKTSMNYKVSGVRRVKTIDDEKIISSKSYEEYLEKFIVGNNLIKLNEPIKGISDKEKTKILCHYVSNVNISDKTSAERETFTGTLQVNSKPEKLFPSKNGKVSFRLP